MPRKELSPAGLEPPARAWGETLLLKYDETRYFVFFFRSDNILIFPLLLNLRYCNLLINIELLGGKYYLYSVYLSLPLGTLHSIDLFISLSLSLSYSPSLSFSLSLSLLIPLSLSISLFSISLSHSIPQVGKFW